VIKLVIVIGAACVLFLLARLTSTISYAQAAPSWTPEAEPPKKVPAVVGSELPFPFDVRDLYQEFPEFNRPNVRNYYFRETDLVTGPADPTSFFDEFLIDLESPKTGERWTDSYFVGTPDGIKAAMREENKEFVCCTKTIIVAEFDLASILRAVLQLYAEADAVEKVSDQQPKHLDV